MKNLLIFTLCVVFCRGFPILGGYQQMDITSAQQDPEVQVLIKNGLQQIIDDGLEEEEFSSSNFELTKINSVFKQVNNGNSYIINCEFVNDEDMVVTASFQAAAQDSTPDITNLEYTVKQVTVAERVEESFMQVSSLEAQFSSEIKDLTNYGADDVKQRSISDGRIPDKTYRISKVRSVSRQVKETALFYKFNLRLKSDEDNEDDVIVVETNFTVYYQPLQNIKSVTDYICEVGGQESSGSKIVIATIIKPEDSQYTALPDKEVNDNSVGRTALDFGREQITNIAINDGTIPNTTLEVLEVTQAESQIVGNGMFYKFNCRLGDEDNVKLTAVFSVYIDLDSSEKIMVEYSYQLDNGDTGQGQGQEEESTEDGFEQLSVDQLQSDTEANSTFQFGASNAIKQSKADGDIPDEDFTVDNVIKAERKNGDKGNLYKFGCDIADSQESQLLEVNFVVYYQFSSKRRTLSSYSHKTKEENTISNASNISTTIRTKDFPVISIDGDYVPCTQEEIDSDPDIQNALNYGAIQVSIIGIQDGKIPDSNFTIKTVISVSKQTTPTITSYRCNVVLENSDGVNTHAEFTVFYDPSIEKSSLSSYLYTVSEGAATDSPTQNGTETSNTTTPETQVANTGYIEINNDEIKYSSEIQSCIKFGADQIIPNARNYTLTKINKVSRKVVESTLYYKCDIELNQNNTVAQLTFTVFHQPEINQKDVIAYSYKTRKSSRSSSTSSSPNSGWWKSSNSWSYQNSSSSPNSSSNPSFSSFSSYKYSKIPVSTVESDPKYKNILNYGIDQCVNELKDNRVVSDSKFQDSELLEAFTQDAEGYESCKLKVKLTNSAGISLDVNFNVQYKTNTDKMNLTSYSCEGSSLNQTQVLIADYVGERGSQLQIGNYEKIIQQQFEVDPIIQEAIDYGVEQVKQNVEAKENIDTSGYSVKEVKNIFREVVDDSSYRVDAILEDDQGSTIDCSFAVNYQPQADEKELEFYSYIIY